MVTLIIESKDQLFSPTRQMVLLGTDFSTCAEHGHIDVGLRDGTPTLMDGLVESCTDPSMALWDRLDVPAATGIKPRQFQGVNGDGRSRVNRGIGWLGRTAFCQHRMKGPECHIGLIKAMVKSGLIESLGWGGQQRWLAYLLRKLTRHCSPAWNFLPACTVVQGTLSLCPHSRSQASILCKGRRSPSALLSITVPENGSHYHHTH